MMGVAVTSQSLVNGLSLQKAFQKCVICQFPSTERKVMVSFVFSIVTTFQIWVCHVTCVYKLHENFVSRDTLLNFRKSHQI